MCSVCELFIRKQGISGKTNMEIFMAIYRPLLIFGCESWILSEEQRSIIQAVGMKY